MKMSSRIQVDWFGSFRPGARDEGLVIFFMAGRIRDEVLRQRSSPAVQNFSRPAPGPMSNNWAIAGRACDRFRIELAAARLISTPLIAPPLSRHAFIVAFSITEFWRAGSERQPGLCVPGILHHEFGPIDHRVAGDAASKSSGTVEFRQAHLAALEQPTK